MPYLLVVASEDHDLCQLSLSNPWVILLTAFFMTRVFLPVVLFIVVHFTVQGPKDLQPIGHHAERLKCHNQITQPRERHPDIVLLISYSTVHLKGTQAIQEDQECRKLINNATSKSFDATSTVDVEKEPSEQNRVHAGVATCYEISMGKNLYQNGTSNCRGSHLYKTSTQKPEPRSGNQSFLSKNRRLHITGTKLKRPLKRSPDSEIPAKTVWPSEVHNGAKGHHRSNIRGTKKSHQSATKRWEPSGIGDQAGRRRWPPSEDDMNKLHKRGNHRIHVSASSQTEDAEAAN